MRRNKIKNYFRRTMMNKICAVVLILTGLVTVKVLGDATMLLFISMVAIPLFFSRKNWMRL